MAANPEISALIQSLRQSSATGSVTPAVEAAILDRLNTADGATDETVATQEKLNKEAREKIAMLLYPANQPTHTPTLDENGKLRLNQMPERVVLADPPSNEVHDLDGVTPKVISKVWARLFHTVTYQVLLQPLDFDATKGTSANIPFAQPGYHAGHTSEVDGETVETPFYIGGLYLSLPHAIGVLFDRWTVGTGGVQSSALINMPMQLKETDSNIDMSYTICNNPTPRVLQLGRMGWGSLVAPKSLYRAFHNAKGLEAIVGVLDLSYIKSDAEIRNAFADCPNLRRMLIRCPDNGITTLDLSGVSPRIAEWFWVTGSEGTMPPDGKQNMTHAVNPLVFLINSLTDRTEPITIHIPTGAWMTIRHDPDWITAVKEQQDRGLELTLKYAVSSL